MDTFATTADTADALRGRVVQTGKNEFEAPDHIIKTVTAARAIYERLRQNNIRRTHLYAEIEGLIQGNPPYDPKELAKAGLSHIANFNDMTAMSIFERACLSYYNLLYSTQHMTRFVLRGELGKVPQAADWIRILAENWDYAVNTYWPSFLTNVCSLQAQVVKFGLSPAFFHDERDPTWRVIDLSCLKIPDSTQSDLDLVTTVCVETEYTLQYLWSVYQEFKGRKWKDEVPWNTDEIGRLLVFFTLGTTRDSVTPLDFLEMERKILNGDIGYDRFYNDSVRVVSLFQKEFSGEISHYMFHRYYSSGGGTDMVSDAVGSNFLFFQDKQYKHLNEALVLFTASPGAFTIHSNRGLGHKIFSAVQAKIQLDCTMIDMAKWSATPLLKSSSLNGKDVQQIRFYPGSPTNIGTAEFVQNNLGANLQNLVPVAQYMDSLIQKNINYSGSDPASPDPDKGSLAPEQIRIMALNEFGIMKNSSNHFYKSFDRIIQNMTGKMLSSKSSDPKHEMAECWVERCIEDGVPEVVFDMLRKSKKDDYKLPKLLDVYATRAAGAGSQTAEILALQTIQPMIGSFGVKAVDQFKRQIVIALFGKEYVPAYMQDSEDTDEHSGGSSLAGVENVAMQAGKSPIFSSDNEQIAHFDAHNELFTYVVQAIQQQQMDVIEADSIFNVLVPHQAAHLNALGQNVLMRGDFEKRKPQFDQLVKFSQLNRANAAKEVKAKMQKQQADQQATQQVMGDEQRKNLVTMNDEHRKDVKLAAQTQRQEKAGDAKEKALAKKTDADIEIKTMKVTGEHHVNVLKVGLENTAIADANSNPSDYLRKLNGSTPAPYDIETPDENT